MTVRDRCTDTNPHPAHRTQYGGGGVKDCPGIPMTRPEELREERVKTGRLEGDLRSQTRAVREALAARDEATRICGEAGIEIYRLRAELDEARAELRHVGQVLTDWRRAFTDEPAHEADRVLVDLIDAGLVPTAAALGSPRRAQESTELPSDCGR